MSKPLHHERPSCQWDEVTERFVVRASALGSCPKALAVESTGEAKTAIPISVQKAFDQGHQFEEAILDGWATQAINKNDKRPILIVDQYPISYEHDKTPVTITGTIDRVVTRHAADSPPSHGVLAPEEIAVVDAKGISDKIDVKPGDDTRAYMLEKYRFQLDSYVKGVRNVHPEIIPTVFVAVGRINRNRGYLNPEIEVYRYSAVEVEAAAIKGDLLKRLTLIHELSVKANLQGWKALAYDDCMSNAYSCPMEHLHLILQPADSVDPDSVPDEVLVALQTLTDTAKRVERFKPTLKREKDAKATVRKWLDGLGDEGLGTKSLDGWEIKFTQGDETEEVKISVEELREVLSVYEDSEHLESLHIKTKEGRKTMTMKRVGKWVSSD